MTAPLIERSEIVPVKSRAPGTEQPLTVEVKVLTKGDSYTLTVYAWEPGVGGRSANLYRSARSLAELAAMQMSPEAGLLLREAWPVVGRALRSTASSSPSLPPRLSPPPSSASKPRGPLPES